MPLLPRSLIQVLNDAEGVVVLRGVEGDLRQGVLDLVELSDAGELGRWVEWSASVLRIEVQGERAWDGGLDGCCLIVLQSEPRAVHGQQPMDGVDGVSGPAERAERPATER